MAELINWKEAVVIQKNIRTGAIPAGFEFMIRFLKIKNVNLDTFQDDFDFKAKGEAENNFETIAQAIEKKYPQIKIRTKNFAKGAEKVDFITNLIEKNIPSMLSLTLSSKKSLCHEMPVIYIDYFKMRLIWRVNQIEEPDLFKVENQEVIDRHNNWLGGKDLAWVEL